MVSQTVFDPGARAHLMAAAIEAEALQGAIGEIIRRIGELEAQQPWGHRSVYGKEFEHTYHHDNGGAEAAKREIPKLMEGVAGGALAGVSYIDNAIQIDEFGSNPFRQATR